MGKQLNLSEVIYSSIIEMSNCDLKHFILDGIEMNNCSFKRFKMILELQFITNGKEIKEKEIDALNKRLDAIFECEIKESKEYLKFRNVASFFSQYNVQF